MLVTNDDIYHTDEIFDYLDKNKEKLNLRSHVVPKGQHIFEQGQTIRDILFIRKGSISLHRNSVHGRRYQVGTFTHNGFLGLMELFSTKPCFYTVIAESDVDAFVVDGPAFADLVIHSPELSAHTFKHLTSKWYLSIERMTRNILHSISYCVIDDLLLFSENNPGQNYIVNKSLESERLGTNLRVYNRILKQLSEHGAIKVERKYIQILNIEALKEQLEKEADR